MHTILYVENSVIINSFIWMLSFHLTIFAEFFNHMKTLHMCSTIWANPLIMSSTIGNMKVVGRLLKCLLTCSTSLQIWHVCKSVVCDNQHDRIHDRSNPLITFDLCKSMMHALLFKCSLLTTKVNLLHTCCTKFVIIAQKVPVSKYQEFH